MSRFSTLATAAARGLRSSLPPTTPKRILTIGMDALETNAHYVVPNVLQGLVENGVLNGTKMMIGLDRDLGVGTQESRALMQSVQKLFAIAPPGMKTPEVMARVIDRHVADTMARRSDLPEELIRMEAVHLIRNILWQKHAAQTGHQLVPLSKGRAELEVAKDIANLRLGGPQSAEILGKYARALTQEATENILDIASQGASTIVSCVSAVNCAQIAAACKDRGTTNSAGAKLAAAGYEVMDPFLFVSERDGVPVYGSVAKSEVHQKIKNSINQSPLATKVMVKTFNATNSEEKLIEQMTSEIKGVTTNVAKPQSGSRLDGRGNNGRTS